MFELDAYYNQRIKGNFKQAALHGVYHFMINGLAYSSFYPKKYFDKQWIFKVSLQPEK